jgi:AcrR family transcriptional regulator
MSTTSTSRPRMAGEREPQVFEAALALLVESGYDRLTLDAVAARARASKATLYRRWSSKAELIVEAFASHERDDPTEIDTGSLRGDLEEISRRKQGAFDPLQAQMIGALVTAISRDETLAATFRERFLTPRMCAGRAIFERARERGEIDADVDLDLLVSVLPALMLYNCTVSGLCGPADALARRIVEQILLPAARGHHCG